MAKALLSFGPLVVIVDAVSWQDYLGGIIQHHCSSGEANHAVLITGFDRTGKSQCTESLPRWSSELKLPRGCRDARLCLRSLLTVVLTYSSGFDDLPPSFRPPHVCGRCFSGHSILWVAYTRPALGHWATLQSMNDYFKFMWNECFICNI